MHDVTGGAARLATLPRRNRAVLYLRQSKDREDSESIENQEYLGREYCRQNGYDVVAVHVDRVSGRKWDQRPGVRATMDLVEARRADVIVLWKWSRLSRSRLHWALALDRVEKVGGRIESVTEPLDTATASGRFARDVMTGYAQFQSDQMGEIWKETLDRRRRKGLPPSGGERFGYVRDREADTYAPHPEQAPTLVEMYRRYIDGHGMASIARWLNESGRLPNTGTPWTGTTVRGVLDRGFAAGFIATQGDGPKDRSFNYLPGAHAPLIEPEVWDAYLARRAAVVRPPRGGRRMASGLLRCAACGGTMFVSSSSGDKGYYTCSKYHRGRGNECPARTSITRSIVERFLSEWITELPTKTEQLRAAEEAHARAATQTIEDRAALTRLIGRAEKRLGALTIKLLDGDISQAAYDATSERLNAELVSLRERHRRTAPTSRKLLFAGLPELAVSWPRLAPEEQNRMLRLLVHHVEVSKPTRMGGGVWRERLKLVPMWEYDSHHE